MTVSRPGNTALRFARQVRRHAPALGLAVALASVFGCLAVAQAQEPPPAGPREPLQDSATPWAEGVSDAQKAAARSALERGNTEFLHGDHRAALATYQKGLEAWDHPALRFNMARTLVMLDRPLEAYDNLGQALRYGPEALEEHVYQEAQGYLRLLRGQVGEVTVRCSQQGVQFGVDGRPLLVCPGSQMVRLLPGPHQFVGSGAGHLTQTRSVQVVPGAPMNLDLQLVSLRDATHMERRWAVWKPWAVVGGSAVLGGLAGMLRWQANRNNDEYGEDVARLCADRPCSDDELPSSTQDLSERATRQNRSALALGAVAGAGLVTGLLLVIMNQPRAVIVRDAAPVSASLRWQPELGAFESVVSVRF